MLHLAWSHPTGPNTEDLNHTVITRAGRIGATNPIQSGWTGFTNAALVVEPGGLRAFWDGFRTTDTNDPQRETNTALSADGGASWALQAGQINPDGAQSYGSNTAATVRADGTTIQAFAGTLGTWVHAASRRRLPTGTTRRASSTGTTRTWRRTRTGPSWRGSRAQAATWV